MPRISAVIPTFNRRQLLVSLVKQLQRQTVSLDEVIVVDNGSTDGSIGEARQLGCTVVEMGENAGFCRAVNEGIRVSRSEWIAVMNNDLDLAPDWTEKLMHAAQVKDVWFATGKIHSRSEPARLDGTFDLVSRAACAWRAGAGRMDHPVWDASRRIRIASFTAALFRAELFKTVGMLDERFGSYLEDVDFGLRCAIAGFSGVYEPSAQAWHHGSATWGAWSPATVTNISRNQVILAAKYLPSCGWPVIVGQVLWGLVALRHRCGLAWLRGKWQGVRVFGQVRHSEPAIPAILVESEREILSLQQRTGFDAYWRWYFRLT